MKNIFWISIALLIGFLLGWLPHRSQHQTDAPSQSKANTKELAKLFPDELALTALKDMRVVTSLNSNDVATAKKLLIQDLDIHASSLSGLSGEIELSQFNSNALKDSEIFLSKFK